MYCPGQNETIGAGLKDVPDAEDVVLKPSMVLVLSTGVFVPDVGGCRFEEDVLPPRRSRGVRAAKGNPRTTANP